MKKNWLKVSLATVVLSVIGVGYQANTDAGPGDKKVAICHRGQTLEVPEQALQAHLNHGDTMGPCVITPSKNQ